MAIEIERKFLLRHPPDPSTLGAGEGFCQGYLCTSPVVRIRIGSGFDGERAWLTLKGAGLAERLEFEYVIPVEDARAMLSLCSSRLEKTRFRVEHAGMLWEVDRFGGSLEGLWLAEVELDALDQQVRLPAWVGDEVTGDPRYSNAALAASATIPGR